MPRHCERPGCTQPAEVIYGMSAAALSVWLEPYDEALASRVGVLCLRHADAMVVPRGWTLEDRREVARPLFRSPPAGQPASGEPSPPERPKRARRRVARGDDTGQLELGVAAADEPQPEPSEPIEPTEHVERIEPTEMAPDAAQVEAAEPVVAQLTGRANGIDADGTPFNPWRPKFDQTDDLDGLLQARSPLLARAFRGRGPQGVHAAGQHDDPLVDHDDD